ncbi:ABC transporter substrate-binding protein [Staphylococcus massiliensis]|uniref:ABC transporter substrate-binding protein n=1 Tax=Staphylococcus massiliensis TaxID=555791 RepID=UPI001EDEAE88|nr:ABC transporter substrate-binding protein [Staphylococcus massiliensis]MCG3402330.1 ABC transporter substrate-binding protein [Staphylococcus massiliensis]
MRKFIFSVLIISMILVGCGVQNAPPSNTLRMSIPLKSSSIAPYDTDTAVQVGAVETLFKTTDDGEVRPWLVEDVKQVSSRKLQMKVKPGIHFQNGHALTAKSIEASLKYALKRSDMLKGTLPIASVDSHGHYVEITTTSPYPELKSELASPFAGIIDTSSEKDPKRHPIGTGPYQVSEFKPSEKIKLQRFDEYWDGKPKLDGVEVRYQEDGNLRVDNLLSGDIDLTNNIPVHRIKSLKASDEAKVAHTPGFRTSLLLYNNDSDAISKPVRRAMDLVINRKQIADVISSGYAKPAVGPFNTELDFIKDKQPTKVDVKQARRIMEELGYSAKRPLKLNMISYDGRPELPKIAQVIQSEAKQAHIDVEIRNVNDIEGYLAEKDKWDISMYSFNTMPRGDTGYFFNSAYLKDGSINKGGYHNKAVTKLIDKLNHTTDVAERHRLSNRILSVSKTDTPNSYITYNDEILGMNQRVKGVDVTPTGAYLIDSEVYIDEDND